MVHLAWDVRTAIVVVAIGVVALLGILGFHFLLPDSIKRALSAKTAKARAIRFGIFLVAMAALYGYIQLSFVTTPSGRPTVFAVEDGPIYVPFSAEGGLYYGVGHGDILKQEPPDSSLTQRRGFRFVAISTINQLAGHVILRTNSDALAYVRLFSLARNLWLKTPRDLFEIMPRDEAAEYLRPYHDELAESVVAHGGDGDAGIVSRAWFNSHHLSQPTVIPSGDGWEIHRTCVMVSWTGPYKPVRVTEKVGPDGSYSRSDEPIDLPAPKDGWGYGFADD